MHLLGVDTIYSCLLSSTIWQFWFSLKLPFQLKKDNVTHSSLLTFQFCWFLKKKAIFLIPFTTNYKQKDEKRQRKLQKDKKNENKSKANTTYPQSRAQLPILLFGLFISQMLCFCFSFWMRVWFVISHVLCLVVHQAYLFLFCILLYVTHIVTGIVHQAHVLFCQLGQGSSLAEVCWR